MTTQRLMLVFGGRSAEHEVSIRSASEVVSALDRQRFEPVLLGVRRDGTWVTGRGEPREVIDRGDAVSDLRALGCDVVFPILHGPHGEDGSFQGLLESLALPYVGSGVLASALCMSKRCLKSYLVGCHVHSTSTPRSAGGAPDKTPAIGATPIPTVEWVEHDQRLHRGDYSATVAAVESDFGYPCFIKPDTQGSSVGVTKASNRRELVEGLELATQHDHWVIIERGISGRELEVAVLGDGGADTLVSDVGEIILPEGKWYDYETKYVTDDAQLVLPAQLNAPQRDQLRHLALGAFRLAGCHGLARIDFFIETASGRPYLNEINTLPGFTSISMYPKLMQLAGISYAELITRLAELALAQSR